MNFKQIASYDNFMLANMTLGLLQENEINCHLKDENIVTIDPLLNPAVGGIKLLVAETDFDSALGLIKDAETTYLNDITCPYCKKSGLTAEEKISKPDTFWGKLKNQIAYGQTETYSKKYRCQHCKSIMNELPLSF
jgi:Putative prokaryotic signal transducing protein